MYYATKPEAYLEPRPASKPLTVNYFHAPSPMFDRALNTSLKVVAGVPHLQVILRWKHFGYPTNVTAKENTQYNSLNVFDLT